MLEYSLPPGYQRRKPIRRPKLGPWQGVIEAILKDDKERPKKQRHMAKRIFERLRTEHGYTGGYTIVKDYVRASKIGSQEMFVPLSYAPGEAQADFGEALVVIAGVAPDYKICVNNPWLFMICSLWVIYIVINTTPTSCVLSIG
jgi:transposase